MYSEIYDLKKILKVGSKVFELSAEPVSAVLDKNYFLIDRDTGEKYDYVQVEDFYFCGMYAEHLLRPEIVVVMEKRFKEKVLDGERVYTECKDISKDEAEVTFDELELEGFDFPINVNLLSFRRTLSRDLLFFAKLGKNDHLGLQLLKDPKPITNIVHCEDVLLMKNDFGSFHEIPLLLYVVVFEGKKIKDISIETYNSYRDKFDDIAVDLDSYRKTMTDKQYERSLKFIKQKAETMYEVVFQGKILSFPKDDCFEEYIVYYDKDLCRFVSESDKAIEVIEPRVFEIILEKYLNYNFPFKEKDDK